MRFDPDTYKYKDKLRGKKMSPGAGSKCYYKTIAYDATAGVGRAITVYQKGGCPSPR